MPLHVAFVLKYTHYNGYNETTFDLILPDVHEAPAHAGDLARIRRELVARAPQCDQQFRSKQARIIDAIPLAYHPLQQDPLWDCVRAGA